MITTDRHCGQSEAAIRNRMITNAETPLHIKPAMTKRGNLIYALVGVVLFSALFVAHVQGQDDRLTREMTLEREFDPTVQDANKVNRLPGIKEPEIQRRTIEYSPFTMPANPDKEITVLPSGEIMTAIPYSNKRGYFNFGGGMFMNLNGDLGYHFLNDEKDKLNFYFSHRSTNGNTESVHFEDTKQKAMYNDNLAVLGYQHAFNPAILRIGGSFGYSLFNYYGIFSMPEPTQPPYSSLATESLFDYTTNQANTTVNAYAGIQSKEDRKIGYLLDFDYRRFDQKYGQTIESDGVIENKYAFRFGLGGRPAYGNKRIGIDGKFNIIDLSYQMFAQAERWNVAHQEITATPYFQINGDTWKARIGINLMNVSGEYKKFFVSPDIALEAEVAPKTVFYVNAGGEIQSNDPDALTKKNRYIGFYGLIPPSYTWLDGVLGIRTGVAQGLWFDLFAGYKITENDVFFVPSDFGPLASYLYMSKGFYNTFSDLPMNASRFRAGASLKYAYQKWADFSLKGIYNNWSFSMPAGTLGGSNEFYKTAKPYGLPLYEVNADLTLRPLKPLSLTVGYYLGAERYSGLEAAGVKMKDINELNLMASWNINDTLGAWLKLNNLLFQKQELWYGYPMQGFSAMIGINLNF